MYYGWESTQVLHQDRLKELAKDRQADSKRLTINPRQMIIRLLSWIGIHPTKQKRKQKRSTPLCQSYQTACDN